MLETEGSPRTRRVIAVMVLAVGALLLLKLLGCSKSPSEPDDGPVLPSFEDLVPAQANVVAAVGDTLVTHPEDDPNLLYEVVFPPGSLSGDATVTIGPPENEPSNPSPSRLDQASSLMSIDVSGASVTDTLLVVIPYSTYDEMNPPLPILFDSDGRLVDVLVPRFSAGSVAFAVPPQEQRVEFLLGLYDYLNPLVDYTQLSLVQGGAFDFSSDMRVVLLIHGCFSSSSDFQAGPAPTMYEYLNEAYDGRVWIWDYWAAPSIAVTGKALLDEVQALESTHGEFPFEIDIVAHSMGGLEARYFIREGGARFVRKVVLLGTPNNGAWPWSWLCYWLKTHSRDEDEIVNPNSAGFLECVTGSDFLGELNTPLVLGADVEYYTIAGDHPDDCITVPGPDDQFIATSSVDLALVDHENVTLHDQREIELNHGQLIQNWNEGASDPGGMVGDMLALIGEALGVPAGPVDPPQMVLVPAGVCTMGDGNPESYCGIDEREVQLTRDFLLGQHEVTNQEYRDAIQWAYDRGYVTATSASAHDNMDGCTVELLDLDDADCEIDFEEGVFTVIRPDHPVKEVTWYGAARYCDWLSLMQDPPLARAYQHSGDWSCNGGDPYGAQGYRLPTDAEWEYAAQFDDERVYPWGNEPADCTRANYWACSVGWTTPVGQYPDAPASLGLSDMAGNVWEWCNDWWVCDLGTSPEEDPVGPEETGYRVIRGGSWQGNDNGLRCAHRYGDIPDYGVPGWAYVNGGLRIARTAAP